MLVEKAVISNSCTSIPRSKVSKPHFLRQASFVANWRTCYNQNRRSRLNVELLSHSGSLRSFGGTRSVVYVRTSSKVKFPNADFVVNFVTTTRCLTSGPLEYRCTSRQNGSARFSRRKVNSKYWNLRLFFLCIFCIRRIRWNQQLMGHGTSIIFYSFCFSKSNVHEKFCSFRLLSRKSIALL